MSVLIKNMEMPKGCIYANDNDQTEYCPLLNHDDVPFCQYIESEPEIAIGIGERPVYCPLSDVPEPCENTVSRQAAIDALDVLCQEHRYRIPGKRETYSQYNEAWQDALGRAEGAIGNLPSAQPEQRWIPCSERLPDAEDCPMDCMVTRRSKYVGNYTDMAVAEADGTWTHENWKAITIEGKATCISTRDADIIAWMPLPEPYKEDTQ